MTTLNAVVPDGVGITPFAWSSDGQQIFTASRGNKIRSFNVSTGLQLVESQILHDGDDSVHSIALAANGKFIATVTRQSVLLLDTSTLTQIGPVIEDREQIRSISISSDGRLATGNIRDLSKVLPNSYGPFHASSHNPGMLLSPSC